MKFTPFTWAKEFYGSIMDLIGFIVEQTSDKSADLVSRALPLVAPLPNAIAVYSITQDIFNFTHSQAFAFSASVEVALFAMIEATLRLFDSLDDHKEKYEKPFKIMIAATVAIMFIIMLIVFVIENQSNKGIWVMSLLPLVSSLCAVGLAFYRWDSRNRRKWAEDDAKNAKLAEEQRLALIELERTRIEAEKQERLQRIEAERIEAERRRKIEDEERAERQAEKARRLEMEIEISRMNAEAAAQVKLNRSINRSTGNRKLNGQDADLTVNTVQLDGSEGENKRLVERRKKVLMEYKIKPDAGMGEVAKSVGVSKATVSNDLNWLLNAGIIHVSNAENGKPKTVTLNGGSQEFLANL